MTSTMTATTPSISSSSRISELTNIIQKNVSAIEAYHVKTGLATPTSESDASSLPSPSTTTTTKPLHSNDLEAFRQAILAANYELQALIQTPTETCQNAAGYGNVGLHFIVRHNLARRIPDDPQGSSFQQISDWCGYPKSIVKRLMRDATSIFIFKENPETGTVQHTPASLALAHEPYLQEYVSFTLETIWTPRVRIVDALDRWPQASEPDQTAWNLIKNEHASFFQTISQDAFQSDRFQSVMKYFSVRAPSSHRLALQGFPWKKHDNATVIDVGGSHGLAMIELAKQYPNLRLIVQDRPEVILAAEAAVAANEQYDESIKSRMSWTAHDFFTDQQPIAGPCIYYLRQILHDWSDKYAIKILRGLVPALKAGDWILINERILPDVGVLSCWEEMTIRIFDVSMMGFTNAYERDRQEWETLIAQASDSFYIVDMTKPQDSEFWMIQLRWTPLKEER